MGLADEIRHLLDDQTASDPATLEALVYGNDDPGIEELVRSAISAIRGCRRAIIRIAEEIEAHGAS
jgi:hypothetical protein